MHLTDLVNLAESIYKSYSNGKQFLEKPIREESEDKLAEFILHYPLPAESDAFTKNLFGLLTIAAKVKKLTIPTEQALEELPVISTEGNKILKQAQSWIRLPTLFSSGTISVESEYANLVASTNQYIHILTEEEPVICVATEHLAVELDKHFPSEDKLTVPKEKYKRLEKEFLEVKKSQTETELKYYEAIKTIQQLEDKIKKITQVDPHSKQDEDIINCFVLEAQLEIYYANFNRMSSIATLNSDFAKKLETVYQKLSFIFTRYFSQLKPVNLDEKELPKELLETQLNSIIPHLRYFYNGSPFRALFFSSNPGLEFCYTANSMLQIIRSQLKNLPTKLSAVEIEKYRTAAKVAPAERKQGLQSTLDKEIPSLSVVRSMAI